MLGQTTSIKFIRDANDFLLTKQLKDLPEVLGKNVKIIQYKEPLCKQQADPENFHTYLEKHILGFFSPHVRKGLSHPQRSLHRLGPLTGSMKSLEHLVKIPV